MIPPALSSALLLVVCRHYIKRVIALHSKRSIGGDELAPAPLVAAVPDAVGSMSTGAGDVPPAAPVSTDTPAVPAFVADIYSMMKAKRAKFAAVASVNSGDDDLDSMMDWRGRSVTR